MPFSAHIARSLARTIESQRAEHNLFLIDGMPGVGKTTLVKSVFSDLSYVDLNDIYPRNLALTRPQDFFSVYGRKLVLDSIEKVPAIIDYLPQSDDALIVLAGYLPSDKKKALIENHDCASFTLMPFSMREYAGLAPNPLGTMPVLLRITYPLPGFFDVMRNGFMPREDRALSSSAFYEKWLADFFSRHVKGVMNTYKDTLFFRFMQVLADHNMQELNHSKFAKEAGISYATAIYWTDFLVDCGVLLEVPSMKLSERRQVKRSKLTYADTGLLSFLLGCATGDELYSHPAYLGVLQGFAAAEIMKNYAALGEKAPIFFYRDTAHKHVELALQTKSGWRPRAFLSQKARPVKESIRHNDVLIKIGGPCEDLVFISDGTLTADTTSYPIVSASSL